MDTFDILYEEKRKAVLRALTHHFGIDPIPEAEKEVEYATCGIGTFKTARQHKLDEYSDIDLDEQDINAIFAEVNDD